MVLNFSWYQIDICKGNHDNRDSQAVDDKTSHYLYTISQTLFYYKHFINGSCVSPRDSLGCSRLTFCLYSCQTLTWTCVCVWVCVSVSVCVCVWGGVSVSVCLCVCVCVCVWCVVNKPTRKRNIRLNIHVTFYARHRQSKL